MSVTALIPAHDEEEFIGSVIAALQTQEKLIDRIIVIADNCTDETTTVALAAGAEVFVTSGNTHKKAGALNQALAFVLPGLADSDLILIQDGDTTLNPEFLASAIARLGRKVGGVCARYNCNPGGGLLGLLQSNEFARSRQRAARRRGATPILVGIAALFTVRTLNQIVAARASGQLPGKPEVYNVDSITEDFELSLALRTLGYRLISPEGCDPTTDVMLTRKDLWHQRIRWTRGGFDDLRRYGWSKATAPLIMMQGVRAIAVLSLPVLIAYFSILLLLYSGHIQWSVPWLFVNVVFIGERFITLRREGLKAVLLAAILLPDMLFDAFMSTVWVVSLIKHLRRTPAQWIAT